MELIIYLFPLFFILHEFEEIIFINTWIKINKEELIQRFPKIANRILRIGRLSTPAFSLAVFEEYILVLLVTIIAIYFDFYDLWIGMFMAFFIHLIIHIIQWLVMRKYIPSIITSFICMPYCIYSIYILDKQEYLYNSTVFLFIIIGIFLTFLNLFLMHKLASYLDKIFFKKYE